MLTQIIVLGGAFGAGVVDDDETTAGWIGDDRLVIVDCYVGDDEPEVML